MNPSIRNISTTPVSILGMPATVSTDRIERAGAVSYETIVVSCDNTSPSFRTYDESDAVRAHSNIVLALVDADYDGDSRYSEFAVRAVAQPRNAMPPPPSGRRDSLQPGALKQRTLVAVPMNGGAATVVRFPTLRPQRTGTIPAPASSPQGAA